MNQEHSNLYTTTEVARMFRVTSRTVLRWVDEGHLVCTQTLGGHRRFAKPDIDSKFAALLAKQEPEPQEEG